MQQKNYLQALVHGGILTVIKVILVAISVQNTWAFIRDPLMVTNQNVLYDVLILAIYEGGMLYWLHMATRISDNPARYLIAWAMFVVSASAVAIACIYEMNGSLFGLDRVSLSPYAHAVTANTCVS